MSVEDIDRRLDDRFALLRGGDRSAPDRHQTLMAVIDWSWNLLTEDERRALRWLSVFHDGFTLAGADVLLETRRARRGPVAGRPVPADRDRRRRDGPLPDARDGARVRPDAAGRGGGGRRAPGPHSSPGRGPTPTTPPRDLWTAGQVEAVRAVLAEENNLARLPARGDGAARPGHDRAPDGGARRLLDDQGRQRARHRGGGRGRRRLRGLGARAGRRSTPLSPPPP